MGNEDVDIITTTESCRCHNLFRNTAVVEGRIEWIVDGRRELFVDFNSRIE